MANPIQKKPNSDGNRSQFLIYQTDDGKTRLEVRLQDESVWLTQAQMAELFQTTKQNVSLHIQNVFDEGELAENSVVKESLTTAADGKNYRTNFYNLDVIISVGYRVHSHRGTQFRQWATRSLREYLIKGFVLDDDRLKRGEGEDYFDELLERIRSIRASERRFYQKITDIYATSIDYDPHAPITQDFYATVQNKLHFAIHGHTAAEIIAERADASKPHMGLTVWKHSPQGSIRKQDAGVAKNYLTEKEIGALNRIVTMYLDYAELQAQNRNPMHMADWITKLDAFLQFNEKNILTHAGSISHDAALQHAHQEFEKYDAEQRRLEAEQPTSDFDKVVEQVKQLGASERKTKRAVSSKAKKHLVKKKGKKRRRYGV